MIFLRWAKMHAARDATLAALERPFQSVDESRPLVDVDRRRPSLVSPKWKMSISKSRRIYRGRSLFKEFARLTPFGARPHRILAGVAWPETEGQGPFDASLH